MTRTQPIKWLAAQRKLSELKDYAHNPRKMCKDEFNTLVKSLKDDGYHQRLLVNTDGTIIGGHSRKRALLLAGYTLNDELEVLIPTVHLSEEEFDRVNIRDNLSFGDWDTDILGNRFDAQQLIDWGMAPSLVGHSHFDVKDEQVDRVKETKPKVCPHCGEMLR